MMKRDNILKTLLAIWAIAITFAVIPQNNAVAQTIKARFDGILVDHDVDVDGDIDVDGTANLDVVDIDGAVDFGGGFDVSSGGLSVTAGLAVFSGGVNCTPQDETVAAGFIITPTSCIVNMTSASPVTSSATTGIITTTATDGDIVILQNNNSSDVIIMDGTGGTIECKANVSLGASDTLSLLYNGTDSVWNCIANYDNS